MRNTYWAALALAALMGAGAALPSIAQNPGPAEADRLLWCASYYTAWGKALRLQRHFGRARELERTGRQLRDRAVETLGLTSRAEIRALVKRYERAYAAMLASDTPLRFTPEQCAELASKGGDRP